MKKLATLVIACFLACVIVSCQSKEERTISKFQAISEQLEQKGDQMTEADWDKLTADYSKLIEDVKTCNFTSEQQEQIGKLEAKIALQMVKQKGKDFGKGLKDLFKKGKGIVEGAIDELKEGSNE